MMEGSSPRVRGKQEKAADEARRAGLIPACAGKTFSPSLSFRGTSAHPRVCGENHGIEEKVGFIKGSSPRVRGKRQSRSRPWTRRRAHPRVCGENCCHLGGPFSRWGSSPRVRGKQRTEEMDPVERRLIPACAGKTFSCEVETRWQEAHPRVCGENLLPRGNVIKGLGSSPRVRGKRYHSLGKWQTWGLIPACAGKTNLFGLGPFSLRAHPRVCGENSMMEAVMNRCGGSSPRVRGKPGSIQPNSFPTVAHPRVCGENCVNSDVPRQRSGSSPRVRGKLL